jgi:hypothetical protein
MLNRCAILTAILLLFLSRMLHDRWTEQGSRGGALAEGAARLERLPMKLDAWEAEAMQLEAEDIAQARLAGYIWRRYRNLDTGASVSILLLYGPPGPISVHTPDACYGGAGYALLGKPARVALGPNSIAAPAEFWSGHFIKTGAVVPQRLCICWSWNGAGSWEAPANPRLTFARFTGLYKLYVICELSASKDSSPSQQQTPAEDFMQRLLPALETALSSEEGRSET